ncbi:L-asparaginase, putative [Candida maltosa Xu316]|uniref:L-asparaginase, putative n=1 Tax=Candida maltosa (strain Xu316) TaxID=1245528 RepID=M3JU14_CANMX|nr:L-asparaginase, putative [Candida maltosa Xu316]
MNDILIIHIGAGIHNRKRSKEYKHLFQKALSKSSIHESSEIIESSPLTNTGYGSSLNLLGKVECDASFIRGDNMGSLVNVTSKCPTNEMFRVYEELGKMYSLDPDLSPPIMVNYPSLKNIIPGIDDGNQEELISPQARDNYELYKDKVFQGKLPQFVSDTIGITHIDANGVITVVASSGGNMLKMPGRIGCAGVIGAGIAYKKYNDCEISCMCSGNGEQIIKHSLAREIVSSIHNIDPDKYNEYFKKLLSDLGQKDKLYVGFIIVLKWGSKVRLLYGHTTESFYFGFRVHDKTRVIFSYAEEVDKLTFGEYKLV